MPRSTASEIGVGILVTLAIAKLFSLLPISFSFHFILSSSDIPLYRGLFCCVMHVAKVE
ncbi:hypothetical protein BDV12DRAFT_48214 [Aspergillus spectabilis]